MPERLSCLKRFLGEGWSPPAHLCNKPALGFAELGSQGEPEQCPCMESHTLIAGRNQAVAWFSWGIYSSLPLGEEVRRNQSQLFTQLQHLGTAWLPTITKPSVELNSSWCTTGTILRLLLQGKPSLPSEHPLPLRSLWQHWSLGAWTALMWTHTQNETITPISVEEYII